MKWYLIEGEDFNASQLLSADNYDDAVEEALGDFFDAVVCSEEDLQAEMPQTEKQGQLPLKQNINAAQGKQ